MRPCVAVKACPRDVAMRVGRPPAAQVMDFDGSHAPAEGAGAQGMKRTRVAGAAGMHPVQEGMAVTAQGFDPRHQVRCGRRHDVGREGWQAGLAAQGTPAAAGKPVLPAPHRDGGTNGGLGSRHGVRGQGKGGGHSGCIPFHAVDGAARGAPFLYDHAQEDVRARL